LNQKKTDEELIELIKKFALINAFKHSGKAQSGSVIGKILGEKPKLRTKVKEIIDLVNNIIEEINQTSLIEQKKIIKEKWPDILFKEKISEKKSLPPLPNIDKYSRIITRFSPNPDCVLHLGSARAIILCYEYAKMYKGRFFLRFEDTDPKLKKPVLEFYRQIRKDLIWLGCKPDEEYIQSDRLSIYYEYAEKLLSDGNAYVCTCKPQQFRQKTLQKKPCNCRNYSNKDNLNRWLSMLKGYYKEGEAVVRIKTDLNHPNPAIRDWPALRIIDPEKYPHPRVKRKYFVWPLYNFSTGLDDHLMDITHIIRGKEHFTNMIRQQYMYRHLGWEYPEAIHYGRLKISGTSLSKSKIIKGIKEGLYTNWDDPRLATFAALRRRGILPKAIKRLMIDIGPKPSDIVLSWENLYAHNRKLLDPKANRYFFVNDPIQLKVKNIPKVFPLKVRLHPDYPERGFREYALQSRDEKKSAYFWIPKMKIKSGCAFRLMELFNITIDRYSTYSVEASFLSESYEEAKKANIPLIHWIPIDDNMPCQIIMPDAKTVDGIAEGFCKLLNPNDIIQFERFGFVRIDETNTKLKAYYTHR
jgi:glutamyl-tRNA synthetase